MDSGRRSGEICDLHRIMAVMKTRTLAASLLTAAALFTMAPAASAASTAPVGHGSGVAETTGLVKGTREFMCTNFGLFCT